MFYKVEVVCCPVVEQKWSNRIGCGQGGNHMLLRSIVTRGQVPEKRRGGGAFPRIGNALNLHSTATYSFSPSPIESTRLAAPARSSAPVWERCGEAIARSGVTTPHIRDHCSSFLGSHLQPLSWSNRSELPASGRLDSPIRSWYFRQIITAANSLLIAFGSLVERVGGESAKDDPKANTRPTRPKRCMWATSQGSTAHATRYWRYARKQIPCAFVTGGSERLNCEVQYSLSSIFVRSPFFARSSDLPPWIRYGD